MARNEDSDLDDDDDDDIQYSHRHQPINPSDASLLTSAAHHTQSSWFIGRGWSNAL
jgi:hypothetical protein